jgi:hypothetical protein
MTAFELAGCIGALLYVGDDDTRLKALILETTTLAFDTMD